MITYRTLLKSLAGLFGAGMSAKAAAQPVREGYWGPSDQKRPPPPPSPPRVSADGYSFSCSEVENAIAENKRMPLIHLTEEQSKAQSFPSVDGFDVIGPDGKSVDDVVNAVNEVDGWIAVYNPSENVYAPDIVIREGNYRIVGLTKEQRLEHVRRFG